MTIEPNASESEKKSPFYEANKRFCQEFENFISKKNGKVQGRYNAWSYAISGKITEPKTWILEYRKSTYSGANLLLTSKYQNLLTLAEWTTAKKPTDPEFLIRRKTKIDMFNPGISKKYRKIEISDGYLLIQKIEKSKSISTLLKILSPLFQSGEVYRIKSKDTRLTIELRTDKHHFTIFNKVSDL